MTGGDGVDDLDGGDGNDVLDDGEGDDHISADAGNDVIRVGAGRRQIFAEQGGDTIYLLNDGVKDTVFCGTVNGGEPGDKVVLVNGRDPLDEISNCPSLTAPQRCGDRSLGRLKLTLF